VDGEERIALFQESAKMTGDGSGTKEDERRKSDRRQKERVGHCPSIWDWCIVTSYIDTFQSRDK